MNHPRLAFWCELEADPLQALFEDTAVLDSLLSLKASVNIGILDLSPERATVICQLNEADIPVIAWLLLPKEQGYWFNLDNASQAVARYAAFKRWTAKHNLQWAGLGMDIEPDYHELQQLLSHKRWQLFPRLLRRALDKDRLYSAQATFLALARLMRSDGYLVEIYQLPFIIDERIAGATLLQRVLGIVDIPADREVLMLYTSFQRKLGLGILWSYADDAQVIGVGSTGGGDPPLLPLDWDEFSRDLLLARRWNRDIAVFSLEGCVQQGFLWRLRTFDWNRPITPPLEVAKQVEWLRQMLRRFLSVNARTLNI